MKEYAERVCAAICKIRGTDKRYGNREHSEELIESVCLEFDLSVSKVKNVMGMV